MSLTFDLLYVAGGFIAASAIAAVRSRQRQAKRQEADPIHAALMAGEISPNDARRARLRSDATLEAEMLADLNRARAANGLPPYEPRVPLGDGFGGAVELDPKGAADSLTDMAKGQGKEFERWLDDHPAAAGRGPQMAQSLQDIIDRSAKLHDAPAKRDPLAVVVEELLAEDEARAKAAQAEPTHEPGAPPPVDRSARELTSGAPVPEDGSHLEITPSGQQKAYVVLSPEERAKGFVRPVRTAYRHVGGCGDVTTMGRALAETYAREPSFYTGTFCATCRDHFPVGPNGEFVWLGTEEKVGT